MPATEKSKQGQQSQQTGEVAITLSRRARQLKPSATLAVSSRVKQLRSEGVDVIAFGVGEPDFDTPAHIRRAAIEALNAGRTHYEPVAGDPASREAIAEKLQQENYIDCRADDIVISAGAKHSIYLALQCLIDDGAGHEVILPTPAWVTYQPQIELAGGKAVQVAGAMDNEFKVTPKQIDAAVTNNTRALIINSPSNPCGTMYTPDEIRALAGVLEKHKHVVIISDEIYEKLIYRDAEHLSIGSLDNVAGRVVTINGLSKAFAMTGWRIGYACAPVQTDDGNTLAKAMAKVQGQMTSNITSFNYPAITAALTASESQAEVEEMRQMFERRGELMHTLLTQMPDMPCPKPTGAFYVFPDVSAHFGKVSPEGKTIDSSVAFAQALLEETGVAVVPGDDFGECAKTHVRLSFACGEDRITEGCDRLRKWLEALK